MLYQIRENPVKITAFNGEISSPGGKYYSNPIQLEIDTNGHTTMVSSEIADAGKSDVIRAIGWWHHEHPRKNIQIPEKWCFGNTKCVEHVPDEGIADMFEWDETAACDEEARIIGKIGAIRQEKIQPDGVPKTYWQYKELFESEKAEMLAPRRTVHHAIDLKDGATPPWGPISPMSAYQLEELNKYLHKMLADGKIVHSKSPAGATILFFPNLMEDYDYA